MEPEILICDDEASVREVVSVFLGEVGHPVECACDGAEALQMIADRPGRYKLVVTDHKMPVLDGLGLVRQLRDDGFPGKIMVLSGNVDGKDVAAYTELAVDAIMRKPFDFDRLQEKVGGLLSRQNSNAV